MGEDECYLTNKEKKLHYIRVIAVFAVVVVSSFLGGWWGSKAHYYGAPIDQGIDIAVSFEDIKVSIYNNPTQRILVEPANAANYMVDAANITFMLIASETVALFNEYNFENEFEALKYFNVTASDMLIIKGEYTAQFTSYVAENASLPLNASLGLDMSSFNFKIKGFCMIIKEMTLRVIQRNSSLIMDTIIAHPYDLSEINKYLINGTIMDGMWSEASDHTLNFVGFDYYENTASIGRMKYDIDGIAYAYDSI